MMLHAGRFLLGLFGFSLSVSISGAEGAGYALVAIWLFKAARGSISFPGKWSPLDVPILVYFFWGVFCTWLSAPDGLWQAVSGQSAFLLFFLAVRGLSSEENEVWVRWVAIGAVVSGIIAIVQASLGIDRIPTYNHYTVPASLSNLPESFVHHLSLRDGRAVATRSHPLTLAEGLLVAFFLMVAIPFGERRLARRVTSASVVAVVAGIVLSEARGVWLGMIGGTAVLAWLWWNRKIVRVWSGIAVALIVIGFAVVPRLRTRALSIVAPSSGEATDAASRSTRFILWSAAAQAVKERPLTGHGVRNLALVITEPGATAPRPWSEAHDIYFQVAAERGIVGLGLFFWLIVLCFRSAWAAPPGWREAGLAVLVGLLIAGLTESWVNDKEIDLLFWAVMGVVEHMRLTRREAAPPA